MKKILIISTSPRKDGNSDTLAHEFERTALQGWVDCFERASFKGEVFAGGVNDKGDILRKREQSQACLDSAECSQNRTEGNIKGHKALEEAYNLGKSIK